MQNNNVLNEKPLQVFVILAKTLAAWKNPSTAEGKEVLLEHYEWAAELKASGKLILAGPTNFELIASGKINPIGSTTGLIMIKAENIEDAQKWAFEDPFHKHEYRKNEVHSLKITMTEPSLFLPLDNLIN